MRPVSVLALSLLLAACQDAGQQSMNILEPGTDYTVTQIDGTAAPSGVTLAIGADNRVSGRAPCNSYGGVLTERDGAITVSGLAFTMMACLEEDRMQSERRFNAALGATVAAQRLDGGAVALNDAEGRTRLRLETAD